MKLKVKLVFIMANVKLFKYLGIVVALMLFALGLYPFIKQQPITNDVLETSIVLVLIGIAYLVIMYNPSWAKAVFFFEGVVIAITGYMILDFPYNIELAIIGLIIIIIAILAYLQKLPPSMLKWFYR